MHYPKKENIQKQQEDYLKKYLNDLEGLFKNGKNGQGYENYVDMTSALDYVLHEEVTNNADSYWCSFFLHKPKDKTDKNGVKTEGKVTLGPAWDFNLAMSNGSQPENGGGNNGGGMWGGGFGGGFGGGGNGFGSSGTSGWQIENSQKSGNGGMWGMGSSLKAPNWLLGMWKDSHYQSELKKRWAELRSGVWHTKTLDLYLDSMKTYLKNAADRNFKRWPNLGKSSGQNDADPQPMKYCNSSSGGGFGMPMGGYNATTWDGEFEHLRKKMKERMQWMDEQLGFKEPASPIAMAPVDPSIHEPDWQNDGKNNDSIPMGIRYDDLSRLSPTNFFVVIGNYLEIHTDIGGKFALVDLNGAVLYKTQIKAGTTNIEIPSKARNKHWIATLNGKMLSK